MSKKQKKVLYRIIITIALLIGIIITQSFVKGNKYIWFAVYMVPYLVMGYDILKKAFKGIIKGQVFDENFLMAIATVGALAIGIYRTGDYLEAVAVMLFYQIGELFQSYAVGKSRKNISDLMDIRPDYANIEQDGVIVKVEPDEVSVGDIIIVRPGEKIPIDGIVEEGTTTLDTSALTGESVPKDINPGDSVISGCINLSGLIKIKTTKEFGESTVSRILDMVENSAMKKSRSENFIAKFAHYYTPIVCYLALALAVLPPVFRLVILKAAPMWGDWIYRALTFLVISCPCALVVSIPLSFFAGIGGAGNQGILIKGSNYIETLSKVKTVVFDKTGTLTQGVFKVVSINCNKRPMDELLELAALAESNSTHPISMSLINAYGRLPNLDLVGEVKEISGHGVVAQVKEHNVIIGNTKLMKMYDIPYEEAKEGGTAVHIAVDSEYEGYFLIADVVKDSSKDAIERLKKSEIQPVMLTGDDKRVAHDIAKQIGIDYFKAELLPDEKVSAVEELLSELKDKEKLAFVGDGINDAPVLSRADVGIAMGTMGSDAAIEAADVVLMDDDPGKVGLAIRISKRCMSIVYQNIYFALGIKGICLVLGALGIANMWLAIFADVGVMVIAVLNAIRALRVKGV